MLTEINSPRRQDGRLRVGEHPRESSFVYISSRSACRTHSWRFLYEVARSSHYRCDFPLVLAALSSFAPTLLFRNRRRLTTTGVISRYRKTDSQRKSPSPAFVTVRKHGDELQPATVKGQRTRAYSSPTLLPRLGTTNVSARSVGYSPSQPSPNNQRHFSVRQSIFPSSLTRSNDAARRAVHCRRPGPNNRSKRSLGRSDPPFRAEVVSALPKQRPPTFLNLTLLTPNVSDHFRGRTAMKLTVRRTAAASTNNGLGRPAPTSTKIHSSAEHRGWPAGRRSRFNPRCPCAKNGWWSRQGANAEFGRSGGGFVNIITKRRHQ